MTLQALDIEAKSQSPFAMHYLTNENNAQQLVCSTHITPLSSAALSGVIFGFESI